MLDRMMAAERLHRGGPPLGYSAAMGESDDQPIEPVSLDEIDRILARELVTDGRATLAHLAATAGLSVSAVQSRVRRLEARGVVTGYHARIAP
jgi:Lrp/AsnC family transcriptional regulator, leucine-responsive regulatory protein